MLYLSMRGITALNIMRRSLPRGRLVLVVWLLLAPSACRRRTGAGVADSTFVSAMAELYRIGADTSLDSAASAASRAAALQERGLTTEILVRAAGRYGGSPERAASIWRAIVARAQTGVSVRPDSAWRAEKRSGGAP